jgi:hypothetical protein
MVYWLFLSNDHSRLHTKSELEWAHVGIISDASCNHEPFSVIFRYISVEIIRFWYEGDTEEDIYRNDIIFAVDVVNVCSTK